MGDEEQERYKRNLLMHLVLEQQSHNDLIPAVRSQIPSDWLVFEHIGPLGDWHRIIVVVTDYKVSEQQVRELKAWVYNRAPAVYKVEWKFAVWYPTEDFP